MVEEDPLFLHLHKLPPATSEETLDQVLQALWKTRKTGLGSIDKTYIQSLLGLPTLHDLEPVLACLRMIIRKCVHDKLTGDEIQKLFSLDLCIDLRNILQMLLQKYQSQWEEETSRDQPLWQRTRVSHQVKVNAHAAPMQFPASELSTSLWPRQEDTLKYPTSSNIGCPVSGYADPNLIHMGNMHLHRDNGSSDDLATLPRLKSMTWTMENRNSTPANRLATITLKLQDYTKSSSGEVEVRFQLSKDTLEAMLRSIAYISEQLSNSMRI